MNTERGEVVRRLSRSLSALAGLLLILPVTSIQGASLHQDAVGREVRISPAPGRIVSLAPNLTEILFVLGLESEVAGVTSFCDWPPAAREKPKIGGFINPSLEAIVSLEPDLVLATADGNRLEDIVRLEKLGKAVYVVDTRSLADIMDSILAVGLITGRLERAREVVDGMSRRRDALRRALQGRPKLKVFVALDRSPLITAGGGTFVDELVTLAGGKNIVGSGAVKYPVFSMERLLASDPEVIVVAAGPPAESRAEALDRWRQVPGAKALRAVREGKVYEVGEGDFFRPGPRIIDTLERLSAMIHPELSGR